MTEWLSGMREEEAKAWEEVMLAHAFEEREWKSGRDRLQELLKADGKQADEDSLRSYLSCAESSGGAHPCLPCHRWWKNCTAHTGMENAKDSIN